MSNILDAYFPRDTPAPTAEPTEAQPLSWASNPDAAQPTVRRVSKSHALGHVGEAFAKARLASIFGTAFQKKPRRRRSLGPRRHRRGL